MGGDPWPIPYALFDHHTSGQGLPEGQKGDTQMITKPEEMNQMRALLHVPTTCHETHGAHHI